MNSQNMHSDSYAHGIIPPQSVEAERYVLGALILEPQQCVDVVTRLEPASFYDPKHEMIYQAISEMFDANEKIDLLTVGKYLQKLGKMGNGITPAYLVELTQTVGSASHVQTHAQIVKEKQIARELLRVGREMMSQAADNSLDIDDVLQSASKEVDKINSLAVGGRLCGHLGESLKKALQNTEKRVSAYSRGIATGITSGLTELDRLTGGWQGGQLIILAARPAAGKTALALHLAKSAAIAGTPVCIYSLEMSDVSLANRLLLSECDVNAEDFRAGRITKNDWTKLELATGRLSKLPIYVNDNPVVSMRYVKAHSRIMKRQGKCEMIILDYLQLTDMSTGNKQRNREQEVAQASRQAKIIAKELDVPVILLSQLSRNVESRADKKPILSDLRESGAIEQDADIVAFIHRPAYYGIETVPTKDHGDIATKGLGIISVAKQRDGATGDVPFLHNPSMTKITNWEAASYVENTKTPF